MKKPRKPSRENTDPLGLNAPKAERKQQEYKRASQQRGHHLEWLRNRKHISEAQYQAGCRVRAIFAEVQGQIKTLDIVNDRVDGGGGSYDLRGTVLVDAMKTLDRLAGRLGEDQLFVLTGLAGIGMSLPDVASYFVEPGRVVPIDEVNRGAKDYCAGLFKSALTYAAEEFGLITRAKGKPGAIRSMAFPDA